MPYLFDASSIILALKLRRIRLLAGNYIQHLTIYEVLNALWKEAQLLKRISRAEATVLAEVFARLLKYVEVLDVEWLEEEVLAMAMEWLPTSCSSATPPTSSIWVASSRASPSATSPLSVAHRGLHRPPPQGQKH